VLPNGDFLLMEEYPPSILVVEGCTGKVKVRYTPVSKTLPGSVYTVITSPYMQTGLATLGIVSAAAREVFSTDERAPLVQQTADKTGATPTYEIKLEGMSLIDDQNLYLANDNDFGIADPALASKIWKVTLRNKLIR